MAKFSDAVAPPGTAPLGHQSAAPLTLFKSRGNPVGPSEDLDRILALERRQPLDFKSVAAQAVVEHEMEKYARPNATCNCHKLDRQIASGNRQCIRTLLPIQAWALFEMRMAGGLLGNIPVGAGKTLITVLAPLALGVSSALLLIPPTLVDQIVVDYQLIREHFDVPGVIIHRGKSKGDGEFAKRLIAGKPTLHVLPYSQLSGTENSDWIEKIRPDAIIADECDGLKDSDAARTKRLMRYYGLGPGASSMPQEEQIRRFTTYKMVALTGSLSNDSITEYDHLAAMCLKENSPLPLDPDTVGEWARVIDASPNPAPPGQLLKLCNPGEDVRSGFRRRLAETRGVIITGTTEVTNVDTGTVVELSVRERKAPPIPAIVQTALELVRNWKRPDMLGGSRHNEEIVEKLEQARYAQQVATGIFYKWIFPRGEPDQLIDEWFAARKLWNKELRLKLQESKEFLDSPKLCETAARRFYEEIPKDPNRPVWKSEHWPRWAEVKDKVEPKTKAVRLHDFLVRDAVAWGTQNRGIIWYSMVEFGQWVAELSGFNLHEGGPNAGVRLREETGERTIVASMKSHGRGRDGLQHLYSSQLITQTPASGRALEQLMARCHRRGQRSAVVTTDVYLHTPEVLESFNQAIRCAEYVEETFGQKQKLLKGIASLGISQ